MPLHAPGSMAHTRGGRLTKPKKCRIERLQERRDAERELTQRADIEPGYLLYVKSKGPSFPIISRTLRVPTTINFHHLHCILQRAFGWADVHGYHFDLYGDEGWDPKEQLVIEPEEDNSINAFISPHENGADRLRFWYHNECVNGPSFFSMPQNLDPDFVDGINGELHMWCTEWWRRAGLT
ncbi:hypothetical protein Slin14017_G058420 [Septoria linicola]|nr:hypothetical protein Slin14017_G058420 [Septoria linicola]